MFLVRFDRDLSVRAAKAATEAGANRAEDVRAKDYRKFDRRRITASEPRKSWKAATALGRMRQSGEGSRGLPRAIARGTWALCRDERVTTVPCDPS
jgi:hypothetical protein